MAIYLDGTIRNLDRDPKIAKKDHMVSHSLDADGYRVIVIQTRDLNGSQALQLHLRKIAQATGRDDLVLVRPMSPFTTA